MRPGQALAERLGLPVRDLDLEQALVHSSWLHEHPDAARRPQRAPRVPRRRRREPRDLRGPLRAPSRRRRGRAVRAPGGDRLDRGLARLAGRIDLGADPLSSARARPSAAAAPAVAARVGVRGARRAPCTSTSATSRRDWLVELAAPELSWRRPRLAQEPQEPAPGAHPADDRRSPVVPAPRGVGPRPREVVPDRGLGRRPAARRRRGSVAPERRDRGGGPGDRAPPAARRRVTRPGTTRRR